MVSDKFDIIVTETSPLMTFSDYEDDVTEAWKTCLEFETITTNIPNVPIHENSFREGHGSQDWCDDIVYE